MTRNIFILVALAAIIALPFAFKPRDSLLAPADETLVIVTPHNEAIRSEFTLGFRAWYKARTGRTVRIDWRIPGGTSEIARYLQSEYEAAFKNYYHRSTSVAQAAFDNSKLDDPKHKPNPDPAKESEALAARRAFLESNVSIGIDLMFGGGSFDFMQQAGAGRLVDSGFIQSHPQLFNDQAIAQTLGGEPCWDKGGRWFGTVLSAFGICYNVDSIARARPGSNTAPPSNWSDLANPAYIGQVALADPDMSGSVTKAFEMIIQQAIAFTPPDAPSRIDTGWASAMRLIMKMGANTRYFSDSATKIPIDVADGDAAIGMCIDFYGRFESETAKLASGRERMIYFNPPGGTSMGVDPIGLLRGAPHREPALAFMEYVMSLDGQKLWDWKVGAPGGSKHYALRRLPIRRELYAKEFAAYRSDPAVMPYEEAKSFTYHPEWTGALFNPIRFIVRVMCVDPHDEARAAWEALIQAKFPPQATAAFGDVSAVTYQQAKGPINDTLKSTGKLAEVRLTAELTEHFRAQYRRAAELARKGM